MKKFECNECGIRICTAEYQSGSGMPFKCTTEQAGVKADWHEVKEEACKVSMQDNGESIRDNKLPDWVKVGGIGYDNKLNEYFEITNIDNDTVVGKFIRTSVYFSYKYFNEFCSEANKRPFNEAEMKALVGKVIEHGNNIHLVTDYFEGTKDIITYLRICATWETAKGIMDKYTINGKPCYKLEHLENGEWVE